MSIFDGLTGLLASAFGDPVTVTRSGHGSVTVAGIFRESPLDEAAGDGRSFVTTVPHVQLRRSDFATLAVGDVIAPSSTPGRTFKVLQPYPSGSPAVDAFVTYELEEVRP
jgi:hypothetical protein